MGIKTVPQPPYSPDVAPCDFWLFPKLRGCRYETIEETKEAEFKVIDTLTQDDFQGAFQKLLERYNNCLAAGGDNFEEDESFMSELSINVSIRKKSGNLFHDPRIYLIEHNRDFFSTYFFANPFKLPYRSYDNQMHYDYKADEKMLKTLIQ